MVIKGNRAFPMCVLTEDNLSGIYQSMKRVKTFRLKEVCFPSEWVHSAGNMSGVDCRVQHTVGSQPH